MSPGMKGVLPPDDLMRAQYISIRFGNLVYDVLKW